MSIVRIFYNKKAFVNVLMVMLQDGDVMSTKTQGDVTALYDMNQQLLGYNIHTLDYHSDSDGYQPMRKELLAFVNKELEKAGFDTVIHDDTPRILVGYVSECDAHPDSDHLHICKVDVGDRNVQIVCGAHNVKQGVKVVAALDHAVLPSGKLILKGKLRGEISEGMLCSKWELGLIDHKEKGLLLLDDSYVTGEAFVWKG